jgi:putative acetyltransferase
MSDAIVIRPERPDQPEVVALLDALDRYLAALYPPEANHILERAGVAGTRSQLLVARAGTRVVGTGAARRMPAEPATDGQAYGEIKRMYVDPALRGPAAGGAPAGRRWKTSCAAMATRWRCWKRGSDQAKAVRLYEPCGYLPRPAFGGYPDNGLVGVLRQGVVKLSDDDFTLFGLPRAQALDRPTLDARRRDLQAQVHPDRFACRRRRGAARWPCNGRCA